MSPDWLTYSRFLSELDVCRFACERYARNYYAWAYRSWLFDRKRDISIDFYHEDIYYLMGWIQQHISDYSAFHHLQNQILALFLLIRSGANANDPLSILDRLEQVLQQQFDSCNQLLRTFQAKESIHLHRRFLLQQLIQLRAMQSISTELALEELATKEVEFIEQQWKRCVQSDRPRTHALIKQHVRWLSRTFNVPIDCTELKTKFDCWND